MLKKCTRKAFTRALLQHNKWAGVVVPNLTLTKLDVLPGLGRRANFAKHDFRGWRFERTHFKHHNFRGSDFTNAEFELCTFLHCDFVDATFDSVKFLGCNMNVSNLTWSSFVDAQFHLHYFYKSNFQGANFLNATINAATFDACDLQRCKNLDLIITQANWIAGSHFDTSTLPWLILRPDWQEARDHVHIHPV